MADPVLVLVVSCGAAVALGLVFVVLGLGQRPPRLDDAMARLADEPVGAPGGRPGVDELRRGDDDLAGRIGAWAFVRLRLPLSEPTRRTLALRGRSIGDFFAEKLILSTLGLVLPPVLVAALQGLGHLVTPLPLVASVALAALGWFWPDLSLRRQDEAVRADAGEALFTYLDLVTLERLANASASQALLSAASISDAPLFRRLRTSLERARLEQRPPWGELHRLADELHLPELGDVADVMRLDEQGAALADTLRARVRELRDAHLLAEKLAAHEVSERMTVWMTVPAMVFGIAFLAPPVMTLLGVNT